MNRTLVFLLVLLFAFSSWAQEQIHSKVMDAETGEPLTYVSIYVSSSSGTLTNNEGEFSIEVEPDVTLKISCIGYNTLFVKARNVGDIIRLKPLSKTLQEVTVLPVNAILERVLKKLVKEYGRNKRKESNYFLRQSTTSGEKREMAEAFLSARSVANLRSKAFYNGVRYRQTDLARVNSILAYSNLQSLVDLGPFVADDPFWGQLRTPFVVVPAGWGQNPNSAVNTSLYNFSGNTATTDDGRKIYVINMHCRDRQHPLLDGTIYVDAEDYSLLSFEGELHNFNLDLERDLHTETEPVVPSVRITYTHENKYTEVESLVASMETGRMVCNSVLLNLRKRKLPFKKNTRKWTNLIEAIDEAGYDSLLWAQAIIQRTETEKRLVEEGRIMMTGSQWQYAEKDTSLVVPKVFSPLMERLKAFGRTIPQEKVYLHMDNTSYFLGDTIWFSVYTRQTNTDLPSKVSGVLYADLYNNDGYLVERKLIEMRDGRGNGHFALSQPILYSGFYELRAYTRWQLNWGITDHKHSKSAGSWFLNKAFEREFYTDYDKLYSRVFPVYDRPTDKENPERNMTARVMRREFRKNYDEQELTLSLFPEGGNLVAGIPNRVAFEAKWSEGEDVEGTIFVNDGEWQTVNRGRGFFTVVPETDREQQVVFLSNEGVKASAKLPKPEEQGVALSVRQEGDEWLISTQIAGLVPDSLALTIMHEGKVEEFQKAPDVQKVLNSKLDAGIHQVTVFDTQGRVWADRLFFVTKPELFKPTLTISGLKDEYRPYEKIELSIEAPSPRGGQREGAFISLSVRDGYQQDQLFDNGNIMTEMLLASEVKGFIPNPGWYFEKDDEEHRQALDLLMMTQGWRRFVWRDMAVKGEWDLTQPDEKAPIIRGDVSRTNLSKILMEDSLQHISDRENAILEALQNETGNQRNPGKREDTSFAGKRPKTDNEIGNREPEHRKETQAEAIRQKYATEAGLKREAKVHAELVMNDETGVIEKLTKDGRFQIQLPTFYGTGVLNLAAADTTKWKRKKPFDYWVLPEINSEIPLRSRLSRKLESLRMSILEATLYPRISRFHPRFVKHYDYYQDHLMELEDSSENQAGTSIDGTRILREVPVKARRRNIYRRFDSSQPAFIIDKYEAANLVGDLGISDGGSVEMSLVRAMMSDYGSPFPYVIREGHRERRILIVYGLGPTRRSLPQYINIPQDSIYHQKYLVTLGGGFEFQNPNSLSPMSEMRDWDAEKIENYVVYSDYCPRLEGSKRYQNDNLPETRVALFPYADGSIRAQYSNGHYGMNGFAFPAEFYSPDYSRQRLPEGQKDYRRTLYWNPNLKLDDKGEVHITLWNNSRTTKVMVEAAGQTAEGELLWTSGTLSSGHR